MRRLSVPLGSYLAVTILVPILNGAAINTAFLEHAAIVLLLTGTLAAVVAR